MRLPTVRLRMSLSLALLLLFVTLFVFFIDFQRKVPSAEATISDGANAVDVIGQYDQTSFTDPVGVYTRNGDNDGPNRLGYSSSHGSAIDDVHHRFFVVDRGNNRVLVYNLNADDSFPDRVPDYVLGQTDFASGSVSGATQSYTLTLLLTTTSYIATRNHKKPATLKILRSS